MELFKRNPFIKKETGELAIQPAFTPVLAEDSEQTPRNWQMLVALAVAALAFAILVAVSATWLYHKSNKPAPAPMNTSHLPQPPPQNLVPTRPN